MKTYPKLRGRIVEKFGTQSAFAKRIGKSEQTIISKFSGKSSFSQKDIIDWCNILDIEPNEVTDYFFADKL